MRGSIVRARRLTQSLVAAVTLLVGAPAGAGTGSGSLFVVIASKDGPHIGVALRQRADFVAAVVRLRSDESDPAKRFTQIRTAKAELLARVAKQEGWSLYEGPLQLSARQGGKLSSYGAESSVDATLLVTQREGSDVFADSAAVMRLVAEFAKTAEVEVGVDRFELAVRDPQQYRAQILKLVGDDAARTRDAISPGGQTKLSGLEGPVLVRQVDERMVELYIDYRLTVEGRPKKK